MRNVRRFAVPAVILGFLLMIFVWVIQHGFVEINALNTTSNEDAHYRLYDQSGNKTFSSDTASSSVKKFVKAGSYTALVSQGEKSDFKPVDAQGFLKTTESDALLQPEKYREFVGDNPSFCMHYEGELLYSYNCGIGGLTSHLPANLTLPTTTQSEDDASSIPSKGMVSLSGVDKVLVTEEEDNSAQLYDIDSQLKLTNIATLEDLDAENTYGIMPFQNGFIVYNEDLSVAKYYESPESNPTTYTITAPAESNNPVEISVYGKDIGTLFNGATEGTDIHDDISTNPSAIEGGASEFVLASGTSYLFDKVYTSGGLCGSNKLCLISGGVLDIYDTSSGEAELAFGIKDAQKAFPKDGKIVVATNSYVLALDETTLEGSIQITYGDSGYCGIAPAKTGFVLCLINKKDNKAALYVDMKRNNTDRIDKKISELLDNPDVDDVSIYKNIVYISPNLGQAVVDKNTGYYDYPAALKESVSRKIDLVVKELGFDKTGYRVINPYN